MTLQEQMAADAAELATSQQTGISLDDVTNLANKQVQLEEAVTNAEEGLDVAKEALRCVSERDLPALLTRAGLTDIGIIGGKRVTLNEDLYASVSADRRDAAHKWLRDNKQGDLIKNQIIVEFGREEDDVCRMVTEFLMKAKLPFDRKEAVNPASLKAFVKEWLDRESEDPDLTPLPRELFGVFVKQVTKVGNSKKTKKGKRK